MPVLPCSAATSPVESAGDVDPSPVIAAAPGGKLTLASLSKDAAGAGQAAVQTAATPPACHASPTTLRQSPAASQLKSLPVVCRVTRRMQSAARQVRSTQRQQGLGEHAVCSTKSHMQAPVQCVHCCCRQQLCEGAGCSKPECCWASHRAELWCRGLPWALGTAPGSACCCQLTPARGGRFHSLGACSQ